MKNKKIKFRGKVVKSFVKSLDMGDWVFGYPNLIRNTMSEDKVAITPENLDGYVEVRPDTIGQFLLLYDKEGGEVYDGDIYRNFDNGLIGKLELVGGVGGLHVNCVEWKDGELWNNHAFSRHDTTNFKVIGNTTDNPNLIEF